MEFPFKTGAHECPLGAPRSWYSIWPLIPTRGLVPVAIYALTVHSLAAGEAETTLVGIPLKRHQSWDML